LVLSTFTVTTTADNGDNNYPVAGSLRWAIQQVNGDQTDSTTNPDTIAFNITADSNAAGYPAGQATGYNATTGVATIQPKTNLPQITDAVIIDGYTQAGASPNTLRGVGQLGVAPGDPSQYGDNAVLKIDLDGSAVSQLNPPGGAIGLSLTNNDTVQGLVLNHWQQVAIQAGNQDLIQGNFLGTDITGTTSFSTGQYAVGDQIGIDALGSNIQIGGTTPEARNLIDGFSLDAIRFRGANESGEVVQGNFIGTDHTGTLTTDSSGHSFGSYNGVDDEYGSAALIGGTDPGAGNLISGNVIGFGGLTAISHNRSRLAFGNAGRTV
jgi:hypothetical protein